MLVSLTGDVAAMYVQIRTTQNQIAIARDNIDRQRSAFQIVRSRFEGGAATMLSTVVPPAAHDAHIVEVQCRHNRSMSQDQKLTLNISCLPDGVA